MRWLIKGGQVVDPLYGIDGKLDILVEEGIIREVGASLQESSSEVINAEGLIITPGMLDIHVHLREPGYEYQETILSGTTAAARGGFTAVACMPDTNPVLDNAAMINFIMEKAAGEAKVPVYPIGAVTLGSRGAELAEMGDMAVAGAAAFSDEGRPLMNSQLMRRAMEYAANWGKLIIADCQDSNLAGEGAMNEGYWSAILGLRGIPAAAEEIMVARQILLAEYTGLSVHLAHISTAGSVELVRQAKSKGLKVTAEAAPHHFSLTEEAVAEYDTSAKVNPPLRTAADVKAVCRGLRDGTIDIIASDHTPCDRVAKEVEFDCAPFGMAGLETAVPLTVSKLIHQKWLTWPQAVEKLSVNPAKILGLPPRTLRPGSQANITLLDPQKKKQVKVTDFASLGKNSPFQGWELSGWAKGTMVNGEWVYRADKL